VRRELRGEIGIGRGILREEHDSGSVLVQTLMDAEVGRGRAGSGPRSKEPLDQADERGPARIGGRHRRQPRRLVHRDQRVVFIEDSARLQR